MDAKLFLFVQQLILTPATGLKHFDWYNGQPDDPKLHDTFKKPAAFMRILPYQTKSHPGGRQSALIQFEIIICQDMVKPFNKVAGDAMQQKVLSAFELHNLVFAAMHSKNNMNNGVGSINRIQAAPDHAFGAVFSNTAVYRCRVVDDSARKDRQAFPEDADKLLEIEVGDTSE